MNVFVRFVGRTVLSLLSRLTQVLGTEARVRVHLKEIERALDGPARMKLYRDEAVRLIEPGEQVLFPTLEPGHGFEKDRFYTYQQRLVPFNIKPGEQVLDIGSGGYPFPYATHLADRYEGETTHRAEPLVKTGLPFQRCNVEKLPYADKEFDFVYCSHVLEHVKDPAQACEELMRIGKRGYIETPTRMSDVMLNFICLKDHHRWHINLLGDTLVFMEWADKERRDTGVSDFFVMLQSKYKNSFQELVHRQRDLFVNMLLWHDRFHYYVFDQQGRLVDTSRKSA
jgi:SAM-dependent methyltransferase